jgi:hypothetical protein
MGEYRNFGQLDEPHQRIGEAFYPDQQLNMALLWAGVNNRIPAEKLPDGLTADAVNCRMRNGDIEPRLGVVKPGWLNAPGNGQIAAAGTSIQGAGTFNDPNTREWQILCADGGAWACTPGNFRRAIPLPPGVKLYGRCALVQAFNQMFCFRGRYLPPLVLRAWANGFEDVLPVYDAAHYYQSAVLSLEQPADEMSYGPFQAVTSLTGSGNVATVVTPLPHGYVSGADITVKGATPTAYNGRVNITVVNDRTFTYQFAGASGAASGTILVSNMSLHWQAQGEQLAVPAGALTGSGVVATATVPNHGLLAGQLVTIAGATPVAFNGLFIVQPGVTANTFTYTLAQAFATATIATGSITLTKTSVTAGHTPDSHPAAWKRIYNVLPNADDALYVNGRLLVPTAYTPGQDDYDATSSYTKADYLVAMDIFDPVHFRFTNGFRINQGDDSEITNLVKYDANTVIVVKGKRWGVLNNVNAVDYNTITFDLRGGFYGCPAVRSATAAGKNVYFPSPGRGLVGLNQTENGILQSMDVPLSVDIPRWIERINWTVIGAQRLAWWQDYLYWAVALDGSAVNNALLVYDFRTQQWVSRDVGSELGVLEFFPLTIDGRDRLGFAGTNGWVNVLEEATAGDQLADATQPLGLGWAEIPTDTTFKGHLFGQPGQKVFPLAEIGVAVWNAKFTVTMSSGGMRTVRTAVTDKTFSRTQYLKPFHKAPWNPFNYALDWAEPNRGDYSVQLVDGMKLDNCSTLQFQELFLRMSTKTFRASYALLRVQNSQGRLRVKHLTPAAMPGERRMGVAL